MHSTLRFRAELCPLAQQFQLRVPRAFHQGLPTRLERFLYCDETIFQSDDMRLWHRANLLPGGTRRAEFTLGLLQRLQFYPKQRLEFGT